MFKTGEYWVMGKREQELNDILDVLEQFAIGNYNYRNTSYEEGVNSKIHNRLEKLGESIVFHNQSLQQEKEETKALITDVSHQLKTPLAGLKTSQFILEEDNLNEQERQEFVCMMGKQITHLENLTAALVNISRMETGLISIQKISADIGQTVLAAMESVRQKAQGKEIELVFTQQGEYSIHHDTRWTKEALVNILDNAIKYSHWRGKVIIRMEPCSFFWRIEVMDEGIGIPVEDYARVFRRFYRGRAPLVKETEGSGVGLYLSRKIIEEQGGNITVKAGKAGKGTLFTIQLPLER